MSPATKTHTLRTQGLGIRFGEFQASLGLAKDTSASAH